MLPLHHKCFIWQMIISKIDREVRISVAPIVVLVSESESESRYEYSVVLVVVRTP